MTDTGCPLFEVESLDAAFSALADAVHACRLLCLAGINHRDLSCVNIIVDVDNKRSGLCHLKLAKRHESNISDEDNIRTPETRDFVALEVLHNDYYFLPRNQNAWIAGDHEPPGPTPFRPNAGHDLESVLWIAVFMLYNSLVLEPSDDFNTDDVVDDLTEERFLERQEFFGHPQRHLPLQRYKVFGKAPGLACILLAKHTTNQAVKIAIDQIGEMECALKNKYNEFEASLSATDYGETRNHEFLTLHDVFEENLKAASDLFKDKIFVYIGAGKNRKRSAQADEAVSEDAKRQKL